MNIQEKQAFFAFLEQHYVKYRKLHTKLYLENNNTILQGVSFLGYDNLNIEITTITDNVMFTFKKAWDDKVLPIKTNLNFDECQIFLNNIYSNYFE